MTIQEIENFAKEVKDVIRDWFKNDGFKDRKLTDTPTDNLQVVNKEYVDDYFPVSIANGGTGAINVTDSFNALAPTTTQGDIIYHNGTSNVRLAAGTSGHFLKTLGTGANPAWAAAATVYKNAATTRDIGAVDGSQTIAHGLGVTPKKVKVTFLFFRTNSVAIAHFAWDGTTTAGQYNWMDNSAQNQGNGTTVLIYYNSSTYSTVTFAVDATNITLGYTKTGTPSGSIQLLWEVEG